MNFHKQKLYSLIVAGLALLSMILPWVTYNMGMFGSGSANGFRSWGLLSLLGIIGVVAVCFIGDKTKELEEMYKKVALGSFGAIAAGAFIFFLRLTSTSGGLGGVGSGFGLWICLLAGLAGLGWLFGLIKLPDNKKGPL